MERKGEKNKMKISGGEAVRCGILSCMALLALTLVCCTPAEDSWRATAEGVAVWTVALATGCAAMRLLKKWTKEGRMPVTDSMIKSVEE